MEPLTNRPGERKLRVMYGAKICASVLKMAK